MDIIKIIQAVQVKLGVEVDGKAGPQTWAAIAERLIPDSAPNLLDSDSADIDKKSREKIEGLLPQVRPYAIALIRKAAANGIEIRVISGYRSYSEQDALYSRGRPDNPPVVTNARGGQSNHNFGIAFDIGVFEDGHYLGESAKYKAVGALGMDMGLDWGGNFHSFEDQPHFQLRPSWGEGITEQALLAELRRRKDQGQEVFA